MEFNSDAYLMRGRQSKYFAFTKCHKHSELNTGLVKFPEQYVIKFSLSSIGVICQ